MDGSVRSRDERIADVLRLVRAADAVASQASIVPRLVASTGLSPAGVELALAEHLERAPTEDELARFVARASEVDSPLTAVILSANVFVGALRAIAFARAASGRVLVRPSRRDPAFALALVEACGDPAIGIVDGDVFDVAAIAGGAIHVYGRDATIASVQASAPASARVFGHGSGMGVALVTAAAELEASAAAFARDVVAFDQRGCLSPRIVFVEDEARARRFAEALDDALVVAGTAVPRGALTASERAEADRYIATMAYAGEVVARASHAVARAEGDAPLVVPPPGRHVHVVAVPRGVPASLSERLAPIAKFVVAVGCDDEASAVAFAPTWARRSALGRMQRPPFDGPVDLRVVGSARG